MININETIEKIKQNRFGNHELQNELCDSLIEEASRIGNNQLKGEALFYKAETYFDYNQSEACKMLNESSEYLQVEKTPELVARLNNLLGIALTNKEDYPGSLNYYLIALRICEDYDIHYVGGLCCCNIAVIFQMIGSYDMAVGYYEKAVVKFDCVSEGDKAKGPIATTYSNIFMCLYRQGCRERLDEVLFKIYEGREYLEPDFVIGIYEAICFDISGEKDKIVPSMEKAVQKSLEIEDLVEYIDNYQFICEVLMQYNMIPELSKVLDVVETYLPEDSFPKARMDFVKYRIACYKEANDIEAVMRKAEEYVSLYEKTTKIYHESIKQTLNLRLYVAELKEKEDSYKKEASVDVLTGLYNRKGLVEHGDVLLQLSCKTRQPICSFIIDIDYFKQYNDCYGHIMGDECIKAVAGVINAYCTGDCVSARFGGDEFVIIGINIDEAKLKDIAGGIVSDVGKLKIESQDSPISDYVSVSVGAFMGTSDSNNTIKELIDEADKNLYQSKEKGRNTYSYSVGNMF